MDERELDNSEGSRISLFMVLGYALSVLRGLLIIPLVACIIGKVPGWRAVSVVLVLVVMALDLLDGQVFKAGSTGNDVRATSARRVVDSTLDFASIHAANVALAIVDPEFTPYFVLILARELMVSLPCVLAASRGKVCNPSLACKLSVACVGLLGVTCLSGAYEVAWLAASALVTTSIAALHTYWDMYRDMISKVGTP